MNSGRRVFVAAGTAAVLAVSVAACSGGGGFSSKGQAGSADSAHLRILVNITPVLTKSFYEKLMAPYEKAHPGVTVTIETPSASDVQATFQQELAAGSPPDLITGDLTTDVATQLTALPDVPWIKDLPYSEDTAVDGKIWSAASGMQVQSLVFYNKTAFAKAGITSTPSSLAEMTQDLVKLKAAGYVGTQTAADWVTGAQVGMMANSSVLDQNPDYFANLKKGTATLADSDWTKVFEIYQSWIKQGLTTPNAMGLNYQDSLDQFLAGKSATYIMGSWVAASSDQTKKSFDVGVFPVPTVEGGPAPVAASPSLPWSIAKGSKNQTADLDLLKYLVTDKTAVTAELQAEGNFRKGFDYAGSPLHQDLSEVVNNAPKTVEGASGMGDAAAPNGFGDELNKLAQGLYSGGSADASVKSLDTWYRANDK
jgi:multiple sugar transport system substrate-binding protein/raffinose/stachyose/melibiose transport system substrate-binding protein